MTIEAYESRAPVVYRDDPTGGRLVAWAQAASAANQLAKTLVSTSFVPQGFKGNAGDATAAIIMGDELGLSPLAAMRSIYLVHGTPSLYAKAMVGLAQAHGHQVWTEKSTDAEVIVCGRRKGTENIERAVWTISRAQKAGYTSNKKYASNPQEMLYAKAASEICRKVAADVLAGVPLSVEDLELEDSAPETVTVSRSDAPKRTAKRAPVAPPKVEEPDLDEATLPTADEVQGILADQPITEAQSKKMHATFNEYGIKDRDERLSIASAIIGADLASSRDLTKNQASALIDTLESLGSREALLAMMYGQEEETDEA